MLVTSTDLLKVVFAFVIFWIGLWVGFACFYFAMMARDIWMVTRNIKKKLEFVDAVLSTVKSRVENTASFVPPLMEGISKIMEAVKEKNRSDARKSTKKKKK